MDEVKATHNGLDSRRDFQFECTLRLTIYPSLAAGSMMSVLHIWVLLMPMLGMTRTFARSLANSPEEVVASKRRGELKLPTSTILLRLSE